MNEKSSSISRRTFLRRSAFSAAALPIMHALGGDALSAPASGRSSQLAHPRLRWLDGKAPAEQPGTTWGVSWPRGQHRPDTEFSLRSPAGEPIPLQTWPTAYWPDGSLKWTAHAVPAHAGRYETLALVPGHPPAAPHSPITVTESPEEVDIDTGTIRCRFARRGDSFFRTLESSERVLARNGGLVLTLQDQPDDVDSAPPRFERFTGMVDGLSVEQNGPVRAVLKLTGVHQTDDKKRRLPFILRLYFYSGAESVRIVHSFILDGDEHREFIRGLGLSFDVPMRDETHNRHIRFAGENDGLWAEAVRGLTGLRRDPGRDVRNAQVAGRETPPVDSFAPTVHTRMDYIPEWGDFTLTQLCADGFQIRKRTSAGHGWIPAGAGRRSCGTGYIGGVSGGIVFGMKDFWQRHPTQLDVRHAASDTAKVTLWLWSPEAPSMDLRFYHDGLGIENHAEELDAMQITYEDYEPGFGTPIGKARTSEVMLWALQTTPSRSRLAALAHTVSAPPLLCAEPSWHAATRVFGDLWRPVDRSSPAKAAIEDRNDFLLRYYMDQQEAHRWYGFWDYGDFMHTYDRDRSVWRYDVGGYAWANSELSPDLWLWYSYLRSGRADVFRLAEAMTRHTGEVDVYHAGRFRGLGTRHNVQHWGCSAKQVRISTAVYRRIYYYLTADERVGDLMRDLVDSDLAFTRLDPIRKIRQGPPASTNPRRLSIGLGTDWGSLAAAWLTEWERTGNAAIRDKLINGMRSIGRLPHGYYTRGATFDSETGEFSVSGEPEFGISHLNAVFGLVEICAELIQLVDEPGFERAWLEYCELYNADPATQQKALGRTLGSLNLGQGHSRLTAYAAYRRQDRILAERAWQEFHAGAAGFGPGTPWTTQKADGPDVLNPHDEAPWVSTNAASQWGLAAIQLLALAGPPESPRPASFPERPDGQS